jgi:hypothetical protein
VLASRRSGEIRSYGESSVNAFSVTFVSDGFHSIGMIAPAFSAPDIRINLQIVDPSCVKTVTPRRNQDPAIYLYL